VNDRSLSSFHLFSARIDNPSIPFQIIGVPFFVIMRVVRLLHLLLTRSSRSCCFGLFTNGHESMTSSVFPLGFYFLFRENMEAKQHFVLCYF